MLKDEPMSRTFNFDGSHGHRLSGRIEKPDDVHRGWAILAHCFTCGKDGLAAVRVARALSRNGVGVLRFDFAGIGDSEGEGPQGIAADIDDLAAAAKAMASAEMPPSLLIGHSFGGTAVLAAAAAISGIKAVATIAAPSDVRHVLSRLAPLQIDKVMKEGAAEVCIAARPFVLRRSFLEETRAYDILPRVAELRRPLLILHAPRDEVVSIVHASRIFRAARHPKSFVSLDTADHLLNHSTDAEYAAAVIAVWASRY